MIYRQVLQLGQDDHIVLHHSYFQCYRDHRPSHTYIHSYSGDIEWSGMDEVVMSGVEMVYMSLFGVRSTMRLVQWIEMTACLTYSSSTFGSLQCVSLMERLLKLLVNE
jgi:hypothetical protein